MNLFIILSSSIFLISCLGIVLNRKNILIVLMSIELMLFAINLNFILFSILNDDIIGQLTTLLILTVAAAESAIGLAILVAYYRVRGTIAIQINSLLKG